MPTLTVETIRIPEMIEHLAISPNDCLVIWDSLNNKTRKIPVSKVRLYLENSSGGTFVPNGGDTVVYEVPLDKEGETQILIPALEGLNVRLLRDGFPLLESEYNVLLGGGVELVGTTLIQGQRYELEVSEPGTAIIVPPASGGSGFIEGDVIINTNINISVSDMNKIHQIRGGANALTITLPNVDDCPLNSFLIIEALISNTKQHLINTTGSQYIYRKNESTDQGMYIGKGDVIWFYRKEDGWYVINEKGNFDNLCIAKPAYKVGFNQLLCDGSELSRALYPKLWREVQSLGASLVDDATWNTASGVNGAGQTVERPYRGCFSTGDGSTTFRIPDWMNMGVRGLKSDGGTDAERVFNTSGGYQKHEVKSHDHSEPNVWNESGTGHLASGGNSNEGSITDKTGLYGGAETRMDNIGILWVIDY